MLTALIPMWARLAFVAIVVAICGFGVWKVKGAFDAKELGELKLEHENTVLAATQKTLAAQAKADADHQQLASKLAADSAAHHEDLARSEHANDLLRASVASGTRVLRIAATCPASTDPVPQAASGGRMDSPASAVLSSEAGQAVLDLRSGLIATEHQLAACQSAVRQMTGQ
jgi:prophage endopeptidase